MEIAKIIDHTLLKADATDAQIKKLAEEAIEHGFASVCINPCHVKYVADILKNSGVKVCTVIGFPLGANTVEAKVFETKEAISNGAQEIDMVLNIGKLKVGDYDYVKNEIKAVTRAAKSFGDIIVKVILETCYLSDEEKIKACKITVDAGADFVKTSTGFGSGGATVHDVELMRKTVGENFGVKASGGIRTAEFAREIVKAGANRIGTSSGIQIVKGW
ncbi:deoxyribose-phosphate aldolase [Thermoanaerobacterium thermosaccharolyticum DSM 571]|uniref:Deoxyribose-phosphate aldolase n=1 Tax=Thermoanaerobacterium thermosaccharolyticum (strain ATCC 7956 / DSM 571 / NCIMB 9385 / NCA 3814 / NCTC 13789 / WDCM 00135 / 2032) TaxID=580327 RepID=D9TPN8_THETC|nr:deoxyribose-phosphate aldolase [Thermoanaerobacterium thermosaccharolyticum]ADL68720.1 deoxyribose-phosphate aldolase [Thermoanaerobacterium thermosaccharolyticum DSM 571]MCP2240597.1 deoxyribose-phosphate aldolase [Thermoanaerobacterium thermosaccharolyticum]